MTKTSRSAEGLLGVAFRRIGCVGGWIGKKTGDAGGGAENACFSGWKGIMKRIDAFLPILCVSVLIAAVLSACGPEPATTGPYARINGVDIYFEVHGAGEPLLLLHGGLSSSEVWSHQIPEFSKHFKVIAMDSRGHGRSTDSQGPITYELLAADAVALLDYLGIERAHVVGWSDGGVAGLRMGISHPERLGKLVTIGASAQGQGSVFSLFDWLFTNHGMFSLVMDFMFQSDYERLNPYPENWPIFRDKIFDLWSGDCYFPREEGKDCMSSLGSIASRVLVMAGTLEMIKPAHTRAIHDSLPNSELLFIPGGTHMVMMEKPEEVNEAILSFLRP